MMWAEGSGGLLGEEEQQCQLKHILFPHISPGRGRAIVSVKLCGTLDEENNWDT